MVVIMIIILQLYIDSDGFYFFINIKSVLVLIIFIITTINKDFFKIHLWSMELTSIILNCPIHVIHS